MSQVSILNLVALAAASLHADDVLAIVDVHDNTQSPAGSTKRILVSSLFTSPTFISGITVSSGTLTAGLATFTSTVQITGGAGLASPGSLSKQTNLGFTIMGVTGTTLDFSIIRPGDSALVMGVFTGTLDVSFQGIIRNDAATGGFAVGSQAGLQRIAYGAPVFNFLQSTDAFASIAAKSGSFDGTIAVSGAGSTLVQTGLAASSPTYHNILNNSGAGSIIIGVEGAGGTTITGSSTNAGLVATLTSKALFLGTNSIAALQIDTSQNVNINAPTGGARLSVREGAGGQLGIAVENTGKTQQWGLQSDTVSPADGLFSIRDMTNNKNAFILTPNTLALSIGGALATAGSITIPATFALQQPDFSAVTRPLIGFGTTSDNIVQIGNQSVLVRGWFNTTPPAQSFGNPGVFGVNSSDNSFWWISTGGRFKVAGTFF